MIAFFEDLLKQSEVMDFDDRKNFLYCLIRNGKLGNVCVHLDPADIPVNDAGDGREAVR